MMRRSCLAFVAVLSLCLSLSMPAASAAHAASDASAAGPADDAVATALAAAENWLSLVDAGDYARSWQEAASLFRGAVSQEQWQRSLEGVRKPLGVVVSREVLSKTFTRSLPGAPDGQYVVIQFRTSFAHKRSAIETVTPMLDRDGHWRVSGYYIK